jgi:ArsR family transcriptional regulator
MIKCLKALADHTRLRILALLKHGELTVQELTQVLDLRQSIISHHLKVLVKAEMLRVRRQGTWGHYRFNRKNQFFTDVYSMVDRYLQESPEYTEDSLKILDLFDEQGKSTRRFFDREASQWDSIVRNLLPLPDYSPAFLEMVPPDSVGAEIGCGTGNLFAPLLEKCRVLIGIDHSPEMLAEARKRVVENNLRGIDLRLGDMLHLPIQSNQIDFVIMNMALHHAAQPLLALQEAARVLHSGGSFLLADMLPHKREWAKEKMADRWLGFSFKDMEEWLAATGMSIQSWLEVKGEGNQLNVFLLKARKLANKTKTENMSLFEE